MTSDPIGLWGGSNTFGYVHGNPLVYMDPYGLYSFSEGVDDFIFSPVYKVTNGWSPQQSTVDFGAGLGDGVVTTLSFGFASGQGLRDELGINGGIDKCSSAYNSGRVAGTAGTLAVTALGGIPARLVHYTGSRAAARSIRTNGIAPSSSGLFGAGTYAVSRGATVSRLTIPSKAVVPTGINNTSGYLRTPIGTYVKNSTLGGKAQLTSSYALAGTLANVNPIGDPLGCGCK